MWTNEIVKGKIYSNKNSSEDIFCSNDLVASSGNSGGPLFYVEENMNESNKYYIVGIVDAINTVGNKFNLTYGCKIKYFIINLVNELEK